MAEPDIHVAPVDTLASLFARRAGQAARRAVEERGRFAIAIPGGSVAAAFLPALFAEGLPWEQCDVFWGDERAVPPESPDSNYGAVAAAWGTAAPAARLHRMAAEGEDLRIAARRYAAELEATLGTPPRLDVVLLGTGEDGHVASLFPERAELEEGDELVVGVEESPKPPPRRLTLTLPLLAGGRWLCVAAFGHAKAGVVERALYDEASTLPVARVLRSASRATLMLDAEAGSRVRPK